MSNTKIRSEQVAIAALPKAFARRTMDEAARAMPEGYNKKIKATVEIDGTIAPMFEAMLALFVRGASSREVAAKRRAAVALVLAAQEKRCTISTHLADSHPDESAVLASIKQAAAEELPRQTRSGSISFRGSAEVTAVKLS